MILKKKIPNDFYKLFRTKNREAYMQFVTAIYEENNEVYASLGLTQEECALIIENTIEKSKIVWQEEDDMEEGETPDALFQRFSFRHVKPHDPVGMAEKRF